MDKVIILKDSPKTVRRFNLQGRTVEFRIKSIPQHVDPVSWIKDAIKYIILYATQSLKSTDKVGFKFCSNSFERGEGWIRFQDASKVNFNDIFELIQGVFQSNSTGLDTDTFCLNVTSVRMPEGRGRISGYKSFDVECARRKGVVQIKNRDNLCLPRAIVVAVAKTKNDPDYCRIRKVNQVQKERAQKLCMDAGCVVPPGGCGLKEIQQFQSLLKDEYKITIYQYGHKGRNVIYEGPEAKSKINLLFHQNHFNVIISLTAAFCCNYFCEDCHIAYYHKNEHRCSKSCPACQQTPPCRIEQKIKCSDCFRLFRSENCFNQHKRSGSLEKSTICKEIKICQNCLKTIRQNRLHTCEEIFCKVCKKHQPQGHLCFMQIDEGTPSLKDTLFIFFDFETRQEKVLSDGSLLHEVNLCVFKQFCDICRETEPWLCERCGLTTQVLTVNPIDRFVEYILNQRTLFKKVVVISHNGGGFDNQFILNNLIMQSDHTPELIMRGTKIILMSLLNVKFLDSLNYFPMPLSVLPKTFGLPDKFKKGFFPHLFNTKTNEEYIGPMPPIESYIPDSMMSEQRQEFLKWYNEQVSKESLFHFKKELIEYCESDATILLESCKLFQQQLLNAANVDPFTEATTIASCCNKVFRRNFLKPDTIGIIPRDGYRLKDCQSTIALQWLVWEERQRQINIQHAATDIEAILNGSKVDGWCKSTNQIFEFHGCYWHGCPECFKFRRNQSLPENPSETLNFRYESTIAKMERLSSLGYEVIEKWECQFRREMQECPAIIEHTQNHPALSYSPLKPRNAFYGGRTGNCKTYYKCKEAEKIKYVDVCSLYPWVCKYGKFPVGHPKIFVGDDCKKLILEETEGLIKCKILPPQNLYHPVLPTKMNSKLMFVLCQKCGQDMSYEECMHDENERSLVGTWVIDEVLKAIEKGYKILDIYEIWKYKIEQYNSDTRTGGLFVDMMNKFIKIKQEASGWPGYCETEKERRQYIIDILNNEGIQLNPEKISKNEGLRSLAKLMLNSFWGKFGQLECQSKTKIVKESDELFLMLMNPSLEINAVLPVNETTILVNYQFTEESYQPLSTVNVCIAAYTTAQARLKLYSYLEKLGERVLYYDTDSVIFCHSEGEYEPPIGEFTGQMTDELQAYGPGSYISAFVSGGPKNYAYKVFCTSTNEEKVICKVKGIKLCYDASMLVNFDTIRNMILKSEDEEITPIIIERNAIRRTSCHEVVTIKETKKYKVSSTKRKFLKGYDSVPYGFKEKCCTQIKSSLNISCTI